MESCTPRIHSQVGERKHGCRKAHQQGEMNQKFQEPMGWEEVISDSTGDSSGGPEMIPPIELGHGGILKCKDSILALA